MNIKYITIHKQKGKLFFHLFFAVGGLFTAYIVTVVLDELLRKLDQK